LLDRQIGRLFAFEDLSDVNASLAKESAAVSAIADQAAGHDELGEKIERRSGMTAQQPSPTVKTL